MEFIFTYANSQAEKIRQDIASLVEHIGPVMLQGLYLPETYQFGEGDFDYYVLSDKTDHEQSSCSVVSYVKILSKGNKLLYSLGSGDHFTL